MSQTTLNGGQPRPLSDHARSVLGNLRGGPIPCQQINPGVVSRLLCENPPVVEIVQRLSPYRTHKGKLIDHLALIASQEARP